jgi:hypothetical protein
LGPGANGRIAAVQAGANYRRIAIHFVLGQLYGRLSASDMRYWLRAIGAELTERHIQLG